MRDNRRRIRATRVSIAGTRRYQLMRFHVLAGIVASTTAHADPQTSCGYDQCPPNQVEFFHPLFARHLGVPGGLALGVHFNFHDSHDGNDFDTRTTRLIVGWQLRGAPSKPGGKLDFLYGLHVRMRPGWYDVVPRMKVALAGGWMSFGASVGVPIAFREDVDVATPCKACRNVAPARRWTVSTGVGLYTHIHWVAPFDWQLGVEIYPGTDNVVRGVVAAVLTF